MKNPITLSDPVVRGSWPALLRAAKVARRLADETGTPFYVFKEGKVVDLNRGRRRRRKPA